MRRFLVLLSAALLVGCGPDDAAGVTAASASGTGSGSSGSTEATGAGGSSAEGPSSSSAGGASSSGAGSGATSGAGGTTTMVRERCRFDDEVAFQLPGGFTTDALDDLASDDLGLCSVGALTFATLDMDGDLRPDLVVTDHCDVAGVGTDAWHVYLNEGDAFAATPLVWSLPSGFATDQLDALADDGGGLCGEGELSFSTLDMDGDRRPDLVVTDHCDLAGVGTDQWHVYRNLGDRFAATPIAWAIPGGFGTDQLDDLRDDSAGLCSLGVLRFETLDIDGDERPDLVVTDNCDTAEVGTDHWLVFRNEAAGFATTAQSWSLPGGYPTDAFDRVARDDSSQCSVGQRSFGLRDLDGDRQPELIITDDCDHDAVGADHWRVHPNQGDGFGPAVAWALNGNASVDRFDDLAADGSTTCAYGSLSYSVRDVDGDRAADLIVTDDCDLAHVGTSHWLLQASRPAAAELAPAVGFSLPPGFATDAFDDAAADRSDTCASGQRSHATLDMDGDGVPELVVADDCDVAEVGTTHWRVFRGSCDAD